jgi:hypothetical protein
LTLLGDWKSLPAQIRKVADVPELRDLLLLLLLSATLLSAGPAAAQQRPVIERIQPASGPVGVEVQLVGRHIHPQSRIMLGDTELVVVRRHPGRWVVRIPEGARSGNITVRTSFGEFRAPYFRVTAGRPAPTIASMTPNHGGPGTEVTLIGENFAPRISDNRVTLGSRPVVVRSAAPTRLVVVVPSGATSGRFVVRVSHAGQVQSDPFEVGASTTITDVSPRSGPPGTEIRIIGTGFSPRRGANRAYLNNRPLRVRSATATQLRAVIPRGAASGTILVDVQGGGRAESPSPFVIQYTPVIDAFSPPAAAPGRRVAIRGERFGRDPRVVAVTVGGRPVTLRRVTPRRIDVDIPEGTPSGKIAVTVNGVGPVESDADFTVLTPVRIARFSPTTGPANSEITIRGSGFSPDPDGNEVYVGRNRVDVLAASAGELRVRVTASRSGLVRVRVPHNGEARSSAPFVVTEPPVVRTFAPTSGAPGTEVTITGDNFGTALNLVRVQLGNRRMQVRSVANTEIVAVVPDGATTDQITVAVRLQGTASSPGRFNVTSAFSVSAIRPTSTFVGDTVVIRGEGLTEGTVVIFPGVRRPVRGEVVRGGLSAVVPRRARSGALTVRLPDGRTATTPTFTVGTAPEGVAITEMTPSCYRAGCHVVIRGHGFSANPRQNRVRFGDRPVRVERASAGRLILRLPAAPGTNRFEITVRGSGEAESEPFTIVP